MSTDLHLRQELLEIRCPAMTIKVTLSSPPPPASSDIAANNHANRTSGGTAIDQSPGNTAIGRGKGSEDEWCRTPKSPRNMIPKTLSCPPAPKKPKRVASCKRKLLDFFEIVAREEVESFFRQFEAQPNDTHNTVGKKIRCLQV